MRILPVAALIAVSLISFEAKAQERAGDAALGAVSGAVVLGPIGAVAGAFVGYTAGPSISRSWGVRHSSSRARVQRTSQTSAAPEPQTTGSVASPPPVAKPPAPPADSKPPPVQGFE
ncbi:MAG: DNA-directed RNA polymerase subunit N [Bradyrhizobium sp.]